VDPHKSRSSTYWRRVTPGCCQSSKSLVRACPKKVGTVSEAQGNTVHVSFCEGLVGSSKANKGWLSGCKGMQKAFLDTLDPLDLSQSSIELLRVSGPIEYRGLGQSDEGEQQPL
jgi:hypothetical protein